jgi:hypothetical protein
MEKEIKSNRRGVVIWYTVIMMAAMCMFASLAVDWGHAQMVKTELRRTADAAALAAAGQIPTSLASATAAAVDIASRNTADGMSVTLVPSQDIQYGYWDVNSRTFTPTASGINAVHVTARKSNARGTAVPMLFGKALGFNSMNVQGEAICMVVPGVNVDQKVPGNASPFLAGEPAGTESSVINPSPRKIPDVAGTDSNPMNSPLAVALPITAGEALNFDSVSGTASHDPNLELANPDGDTSDGGNGIGHNNDTTVFQNNYGQQMYNEHGIADAWIPIDALVGVFLDDKQPDSSAAPTNLDFRSDASRDYDTIGSVETGGTVKDQPLKIKQIFFIGDGLNSKGLKQTIIAPKGATRLFLATMDYYEWNNNQNYRVIKVLRPSKVILVK